ncbi:MAG: hypothetical protein ABI990_01635 [Actinomycetota bacterium]
MGLLLEEMRHSKRICVLALTLVAAGVVVASATADPTGSKKSASITVTCGNTTYQAVVIGNGVWSPAHDLNSNSILIPVSFGVETDVFTPAGGPSQTSFGPATAKGSSAPHGAPPLNCSYQVGPLPFPDGSTFQANGTVTGFITPA